MPCCARRTLSVANSRLRLRRARADDARRLFRWRNHPSVRRNSLNVHPVKWQEHRAWLGRCLRDDRRSLFVIELGKPVGQLRLDVLGKGILEVSISLAPHAQGNGLGTLALRRAATVAARRGASGLLARVKPENVGSAIAFVKAGFRFVRVLGKVDGGCYLLQRRLDGAR